MKLKTSRQIYKLVLDENSADLNNEEKKIYESLQLGYDLAKGSCYDIVKDVLKYRSSHTEKQTDATIKKVYIGVPLEWAKMYKKKPEDLEEYWKTLTWNKMCKYASYLAVAAQIEQALGKASITESQKLTKSD